MNLTSSLFKIFRHFSADTGYVDELRSAISRKDGVSVEKVIHMAYKNGAAEEIAPLMGELCLANWHSMHEDAVGLLQKYGEVGDVPALEKVVGKNLFYLAYDNNLA